MAGNDLLDFSHEEHDEFQDNLSHTDGRDTLRKTFCSGDSSSEEEDLGKYSKGGYENHSFLKHLGHQNIPLDGSGMGPPSFFQNRKDKNILLSFGQEPNWSNKKSKEA